MTEGMPVNGTLLVGSSHPEFVPVVFASSQIEAEEFQVQLESANIPTMIEDASDDVLSSLEAGGAIALRVPEHLLDDAAEVVVGLQDGPRDNFDDDFEDEDEDDEFDDDFDDDEDDFDEEEDEEDFD